MGQVFLAMLSCEGPEGQNWTTAWAGQDQSLGDRCVLGHALCAWGFGAQAGIPHLVLLPELVELVAVDGKLDEVQVIALDPEVQVPEPEHKAVWG